MPEMNFFINRTRNILVSGLNNPAPVSSDQIPFFLGDTKTLKIWILDETGPSSPGASAFSVITTPGIGLAVWLTDGNNGGTIYSQNIALDADANSNQFWSGELSFATPALSGAFTADELDAQLIVAMLIDGKYDTVYSAAVTIKIGAPVQNLAVPPGLTPLSAEQAGQTYVRVEGKPGETFILTTKLGKQCEVGYFDIADGGAEFRADPIS